MHARFVGPTSLRLLRSLAFGVATFGVTVAGIAGCSSSSSDDCSDTQVRVDYIGGARDGTTVCKPIPASCGTTAACDNNPCIRDMYGYCDAPYLGVGCSDTLPPTIISCNP